MLVHLAGALALLGMYLYFRRSDRNEGEDFGDDGHGPWTPVGNSDGSPPRLIVPKPEPGAIRMFRARPTERKHESVA